MFLDDVDFVYEDVYDVDENDVVLYDDFMIIIIFFRLFAEILLILLILLNFMHVF